MIHYFHFADMIYCLSIVSSCNHNRNLPLLTWILFLYIRPRKSGQTSFIGSATQANSWKQTFGNRSFFPKFAKAFAVRKWSLTNKIVQRKTKWKIFLKSSLKCRCQMFRLISFILLLTTVWNGLAKKVIKLTLSIVCRHFNVIIITDSQMLGY